MKKTIIKEAIPENITNKANSKYEFHIINIGEACLYEGDKKELANIRASAIEYSRRHNLNFVTRTNEKGLMVYNVDVGTNTKSEAQNKVAGTLAAKLEAAGIKPHSPFGD